MREKQRLAMHYAHIADPETYKAAIMIAKTDKFMMNLLSAASD